MHAALQFLIFWALAFLAIGVSLVLLSVYYALIGNDLTLRSAARF